MKIYKSNYRNHWISPYTIAEKICFWREIKYEEKWVVILSTILHPFCNAWLKMLDTIHPKINYVKIDRYDTWSMDHTLADIILPMLKQLQKDKHGAPFTEDEDVPEELKSTSAPPKENEWDTDANHFLRWDYILNEMIWAFEQKIDDDAESKFFDNSAYNEVKGKTNHDKWFKDMSAGKSKTKYDKEGHQAWQARKSNGFRLFGSYFEALWD